MRDIFTASPPKMLIGILACHHRAPHLQAIRETWLPDLKGRCGYKFFFGGGSHKNPQDDEVILNCDDAYRGLACKVQESIRWALANGYESFFKVDDDTYVRPERVLRAGFEDKQYVGAMIGFTDKYHTCKYARGGVGYYLGKQAMEYLAGLPTPNPDIPSEYAEDSWVGSNMANSGLEFTNDDRLRCAAGSGPNRSPRPNGFQLWKTDCPTAHNTHITTCEFLGSEMYEVHAEWTKSQENLRNIVSRLKVQ